jgi:predicted nucleotidyltransferase
MQIGRQSMPKMHQSLISLLLPEYRRRVLGLLLLRPGEALHGREIARRTGLAAGTVTRDQSCPLFTELASILRKTSGMADVLLQALAPAAAQIQVALVFGSVAQARETATSDIDLMLIGDVGFGQAVQLLYPTQTTLGREVNPKVFSVHEFAQKAGTDPFLRDVLSKPKIFMIGGEHELAELAGHQP